jgi:hypothetical protein
MKIEKEIIFFDNNRVTWAHRGVVGINADLDLFDGSDRRICIHEQPLSKEEAIELADYMIDLWTKYREQYE